MLEQLRVRGFKSLRDVQVCLPRLTVLFGPNAAGKSNLLDAMQALSRIATSRTLTEAFSDPIRGYPIEAFGFPSGGLPALLGQERAQFDLEGKLSIGNESYQYKVQAGIHPGSGTLSVLDEYLTVLDKKGGPKGAPSIEKVDDQIRIRRKSKPAHPRREKPGQNSSILSDPRLGGVEYRAIERCRTEFAAWRVYYLDPRVAMRSAKSPAEVQDIGVLGEDIAPFLYRLRAAKPKCFEAVKRTLCSLVPSVEDLVVDLDQRRGTLDIMVRQNGTEFSSRIVSEGTLRVLALCAIAANPWGGTLVAFEEPENGVHPRRLELIAQLLASLAIDQDRQVVVTTHSPVFCDEVLKKAREKPGEVAILNVRQVGGGTDVQPLDLLGPLFDSTHISQLLAESAEDGVFESLMLRGLLNE